MERDWARGHNANRDRSTYADCVLISNLIDGSVFPPGWLQATWVNLRLVPCCCFSSGCEVLRQSSSIVCDCFSRLCIGVMRSFDGGTNISLSSRSDIRKTEYPVHTWCFFRFVSIRRLLISQQTPLYRYYLMGTHWFPSAIGAVPVQLLSYYCI